MFNSLYHAEIGGGYTLRRKVIIDAADLRPLGGQIEVVAIIENGDELNSTTVTTEAAALAAFHSMVQQHAEPLPQLGADDGEDEVRVPEGQVHGGGTLGLSPVEQPLSRQATAADGHQAPCLLPSGPQRIETVVHQYLKALLHIGWDLVQLPQ